MRARQHERRTLTRLAADARTGTRAVLVVTGEAGIGKTALLDDLVRTAADLRVTRATGVESDMELPYAGLHQLCAPLLEHLDALPAPHRDALAVAFGLTTGAAPDRFLVGLATLGLLAQAAAGTPLLCVADDAQWLDRVSAQTLAFVGRRLGVEHVALVVALRTDGDLGVFDGLPTLHVGPLGDQDAAAVLDDALPDPLDPRVRDRLVAEARGNPLALLELPRTTTVADRAGGFMRPGSRELTGRIERSFVSRIRALPADAQLLLLAAAAEPMGDVDLLRRAAAHLDVDPAATDAAQSADLLVIDTRVRFRHPLVRSAAYRVADVRDRRRVHAALALATDAGTDPDRRAWHEAQAAAGPDDDVADALERSADRARARGGVAAEAAFLQRATELTPDAARRGRRALAAAQAMHRAGAGDTALDLLGLARLGPLNALDAARAHRLEAQVRFQQGRGSDAAPALLAAARALEPLDADLARRTHLDALSALVFAGRLSAPGVDDEVARAALAVGSPTPATPGDLLREAVATWRTQGHRAASPALRRAVDALRVPDAAADAPPTAGVPLPDTSLVPLLRLACPAALELSDLDAWSQVATRWERLCRDTGMLADLPVVLAHQAGVRLHRGDLSGAAAVVAEGDATSDATGHPRATYARMLLAGWRGDDDEVRRLVADATQAAGVRGEGRLLGMAAVTTAVLHTAHGRYAQAVDAARDACTHDDLGLRGWALAELAEAAARADRPDVARDAVKELEDRAHDESTAWSRGVLARSQALVRTGDAADDAYRQALGLLGRAGVVAHHARARLLYGEWLRREGRRADARAQLGAAHDVFATMGASAFRDRCARELAATGQPVPRPAAGVAALTAQEQQIAALAGDGLTNPQIAAQLFLSPHTVEWHLRKVFQKLGVRSRTQLHAALAGAPGPRGD